MNSMTPLNMAYIPPFIQSTDPNNKEHKSITMVVGSDSYLFTTHNSKTIRPEALGYIASGINHILIWAKDDNPIPAGLSEVQRYEYITDTLVKDREFKNKFLNEFVIFMNNTYNIMIDPWFEDKCYRRIQMSEKDIYGKSPSITEIKSLVIKEFMEDFLNNDALIMGLIKYVYDCSVFNTFDTSDVSLDISLNEYDLLALNILIPIAKIIQMLFSVYNSTTKSEDITFLPMMYVLNNIQPRLVQFFEEYVRLSPMELMSILNTDLATNITEYIYKSIEKKISFERNTRIFESVGRNKAYFIDSFIQTLFTAIFKIAPVLNNSSVINKSGSTESIPYDNENNWYEYKYVSSNVMGYIRSTLERSINHKLRITTKSMGNTIVDGVGENNTVYKQEMFLESRDMSTLIRKRRILSSLYKWAEEERVYIGDFESRMHIDEIGVSVVDSPLRTYILTTILNEFNEDVTTKQLMTADVMSSILVIVAHRLESLGYSNLAVALLARGVTEPTGDITPYMDKIKSLRKYKFNSVKLVNYIKDVICRHYISQNGDKSITIGDEFIDLLKRKEDSNFRLIEGHIYGN